MNKKVIGIFCYDRVFALDLVGPAEAFASALSTPKQESLYEIILIGINDKEVISESGIKFSPHKTIQNIPSIDTLIIPGGRGLREEELNKSVSNWIRRESKRIRRIAAVCTGIYGLATTGLLDNRRATTHWRFLDDISCRFPKIKMDGDAIYIKDEQLYTSAGATAGIDLSLELIKEDYGPNVALSVARELVVYFKRPGGQNQFSEPLKYQLKSTDEFAELVAWIKGNFHLKLSVSDFAERVSLCPRHFNRKFKKQLGCTPTAFLEQLRLQEACYRLTMSEDKIQVIAESVGFRSADVFRRAFERKYGVSPSSYSARFNSILDDERFGGTKIKKGGVIDG